MLTMDRNPGERVMHGIYNGFSILCVYVCMKMIRMDSTRLVEWWSCACAVCMYAGNWNGLESGRMAVVCVCVFLCMYV